MEFAAQLGTELALSVLSPLLNKLSSKFGGDVTAAEMQHLNDFVHYEIAALTREAKSNDLVQSMPLLEKLQAAALELEDLLDLYEYKQIEKQVSSFSSNPIKKLKPIFKEKLGPILPKSRLRIAFEKLLKFVEQVKKIHPFITSRTGTTQPQANTITPTTSTLLSPYFGRENQCNNIIEFLLYESHADSSRRTNTVPVTAIIGMGGSGKSHTAQRICNDDRIKNHFDANMWVHVTRDFDVVGLTKKMLESANNDECPQITNLDVLQKKLKESLSNKKKFLLVLDDVWCDDKMNWDLLVGPLNEAAEYGSKIIITTRSENIADNLHANKFHLEELKVEECWFVLKHYAFHNCEEIIDDQELINVGNQIIGKAKHSPLALRVVGSTLSKKRSVNEWEKILKQDILKKTMDLLLFSYQCLPLHLQRCFAYCSLFPKGYKFECHQTPFTLSTTDLISLWIAQGFIENTSGITLEEAGKKYIEGLLSYSFFEKKYCEFSSDYFVIHDLLHDLAEKVSKRHCHRIEHNDSLHVPTTCIHLSLCITENLVSVDQSTMLAISGILNLRHLRSLIILGHTGPIRTVESKSDIFRNLTKLRTLYVGFGQQMEVLGDPRMEKLKHLRYLHVRYYSKLSESLVKLYQLQFLTLITGQVYNGSCFVADTLPQGLSNLINLRALHFYNKHGNGLDYPYYNSKMFCVDKLTSLQNLMNFLPGGVNRMISLRNLPLCGSLSIRNLETVKSKEEAGEAMLNQKKNLGWLHFRWSDDSNSIDTCEEVLEGLEPHQNLLELEIRGYQGAKFPNWMNWLPRLQYLNLNSCTSLKIVQFLPPRLQSLVVNDCHELMQLSGLSNTLHTLSLRNCPKLTSPSMFNESFGLSDLSFLSSLKKLFLCGFHSLQSLANLSPTMVDLIIEDCPKLTSLGNLQRCTSLQKLTIRKCPMPRREEASYVEGVTEGDIANCLPQVKSIWTDEPLLVFDLIDLSFLSNLEWLELSGLHSLQSLTNLSSTVTDLTIEDCPKLTSLGNLQHRTSLQKLKIRKCPMLRREEASSVEGVIEGDSDNRLPQVHYISTDEPLLVFELVQQQAFSSIRTLYLEDCAALPNLEMLSSLTNLCVTNCPDVESLPDLPVSVQYLGIWECPKLMEKYGEGGPLRNTISHVRHIVIPV